MTIQEYAEIKRKINDLKKIISKKLSNKEHIKYSKEYLDLAFNEIVLDQIPF